MSIQNELPTPIPAALDYQGVNTANAGLSIRALDMLRQTKPWARFISILMFIAAGLMIAGGVIMALMSAGGHAPTAAAIMGVTYGA